MSRNIMITGGAGFIGSHFVHHWHSLFPGDSILIVDALTYAGNVDNIGSLIDVIDFVRQDISNQQEMEALLSNYKIDVVVNFAAESHNSLALIDPARFFRTNVMGTQALLEAARRVGVERFHHVSTCEVYGDLALDSDEKFTEDSPYRPRTPYNASKAGADHVVRAYFETFRIPITISNCANNYGPYQFPEKVLPLFVTRALNGEKLPVYQSKENKREWIHAIDHCKAISRIIVEGRIGETYHVGTGVEASVDEIANLVLQELGLPPSFKGEVPDRPGHDRRYVLDWSKCKEELNWRPVIDFHVGVSDTIRWYAENRDWWEPLLQRAMVREDNWKAVR